jgi:hypothetical protein
VMMSMEGLFTKCPPWVVHVSCSSIDSEIRAALRKYVYAIADVSEIEYALNELQLITGNRRYLPVLIYELAV